MTTRCLIGYTSKLIGLRSLWKAAIYCVRVELAITSEYYDLFTKQSVAAIECIQKIV